MIAKIREVSYVNFEKVHEQLFWRSSLWTAWTQLATERVCGL